VPVPDGYIRFRSPNTLANRQIPYHDGEGIPPEETTVYVRDDAYGECTVRPLESQTTRNRRSEEDRPNRGTDLALIWEPSADKVVGDPTNTSNCHEDRLIFGFLTLNCHHLSKHDQLTSSLQYHGAWLRKLRNNENMGTVRNAVGKERTSDSC